MQNESNRSVFGARALKLYRGRTDVKARCSEPWRHFTLSLALRHSVNVKELRQSLLLALRNTLGKYLSI